MNIFRKNFKNKRVIITGHTGFKGSWLTLWLKILGANVLGISNGIITKPSNFRILELEKKINHKNFDIRNIKKLKKTFNSYRPDYIFHLAAQSLVQKSYKEPVNTFETNTLGTLNILEALKEIKNKCTVILITSDKSYKNLELKRGYKENDLLGGLDPYSSSKGAAELIIQSYVSSYFKNNKKILIGIARAGNVIGGGDWSQNRLVPDCIKSWSNNNRVILRNPLSTRPWQHVLEALGGYLLFAIKLSKNPKLHGEAFNFGPNNKNNFNVLSLVKLMKLDWKNVNWKFVKKNKSKVYESKLLKLNCSKAKKILKWKSVLNFKETTRMTINWYFKFYKYRKEIKQFSINQIFNYQKIMMNRL
jgi:CDP-glucose 4,6-dehydratase